MTLTNPALKQLILDLLIYEEKLNENAQRTKRSSYPTEFFRGIVSAREKMFSQVEVGLADESKDRATLMVENIEWVKRENARQENKTIVAERYLDDPIELTDQEIRAIKFCYQDRTRNPETTIEALNQLEELTGVKK